MYKITFILLFVPFLSYAQPMNYKGNQGGTVSLGVRSTVSGFNSHHDEGVGTGIGGQFRIQFADRVNSDWFFDYMKSDIGDYASRTDYHIGWSVLYYLRKNPTPIVRPYLLAGHCFDYTYMVANNDRTNYAERWSSAVQAGAGVHFNITERLDLSVVGQYMMHLGNEVGAHTHDGVVDFHDHQGTSMEGHLLFHVGINYKIADLW
jgi:opacity protein-like surface antigen